MTDLHDQLTELFESTATDAEIPPLPLREILTRGDDLQRVRRRRAAIWTAAAAAVAVVAVSLPMALVGQHGQRDDRPAPSQRTSTPTGPTSGPTSGPTASPSSTPPTLPYLGGGVLHVDGHTVATSGKRLLSRGGTVYVTSSKSNPWSWSHLIGGRLVPVSTPHSDAQPWTGWHDAALSPDGTLLAVLTHPTQNTSRITAYRTSDDHEIAHVDLDEAFSNWTGGGDSVWNLGIDGRGQVYWIAQGIPDNGTKSPDTDWTWTPGHGSPIELGKPFTGLLPSGFDVTPQGPVIAQDDHTPTLGRVVDGQWQPIAAVPGDEDVWSPSGATVAEGGSRPTFLTPGTGRAVAPSLPGDTDLGQWIGFESETDILGVVNDISTSELVRCEVTTGACATIEKLPSAWTSWQWATNGPAVPTPAVTSTATSPSNRRSTTTPPDDSVVGLARGDDARIPVIHDGGIVMVDGKAIAQNANTVVASSDQSVMLLVRHGTVSSITREGKETPLDALDGVIQEPPPVISPDGRYAAGVHTSEQGDELVEWSLVSNRLVGSIPVVGSAARIRLNGVDDDGRVYATTYAPRSGFSWKPGAGRQPLTGAAADLASDGVGAVGPHGVVEATGCDGTYVGVSPSGSQVLCAIDSAPGIGIVSTTTHHVVPLGLPTALATTATGVGFESEDAVLLVVKSTGGGWLVRCSTTGATCVRAMPVTSTMTFPTLPGGS